MRDSMGARLKEWLIPPAVLRMQRRRQLIRDLRPTAAEKALLAPNAPFNGACVDRRCFVVCNGPSLANQDLSSLRDEVTITMNWFNKHAVLARWKPTFHCAAEPAAGLSPEMLAAMLAGLDANAYFFQIDTRDYFSHPSLRRYANIHYVRSRASAKEWLELGVPLDLTMTLPGMDESSQLGVLLGLALGCTPIYLLGADQDYLSHRSIYEHFYSQESSYLPRQDMSLEPYDDAMRSALRVWESHRALQELAIRRGQRILNATEGGFMDVYPQTTLAAALAGAPPVSPMDLLSTDADRRHR